MSDAKKYEGLTPGQEHVLFGAMRAAGISDADANAVLAAAQESLGDVPAPQSVRVVQRVNVVEANATMIGYQG
jgi:hypothetical protein